MDLTGFGCGGTGCNTRVIDPDHAAHATDKTNTDQHRGARDTGLPIRVINREIGQRMQSEKGHAWVQKPVQPIGR